MSYPLKDISHPHAHDVLCGSQTNTHAANSHWRMLVNAEQEVYGSLRNKTKQKAMLSQSIVDAVKSLDPPGRFLEKDPATGLWYDVGDDRAQKMTLQALEEGDPLIGNERNASQSTASRTTSSSTFVDQKGTPPGPTTAAVSTSAASVSRATRSSSAATSSATKATTKSGDKGTVTLEPVAFRERRTRIAVKTVKRSSPPSTAVAGASATPSSKSADDTGKVTLEAVVLRKKLISAKTASRPSNSSSVAADTDQKMAATTAGRARKSSSEQKLGSVKKSLTTTKPTSPARSPTRASMTRKKGPSSKSPPWTAAAKPAVSEKTSNLPERKRGRPSNSSSSTKKQPVARIKSSGGKGRTPSAKEVWTGDPDDELEVGWPKGWTKKTFQRQSGATKGSFDSYWYSPINQHKLRSLNEVRRYLTALKSTKGDEEQAWRVLKGRA